MRSKKLIPLTEWKARKRFWECLVSVTFWASISKESKPFSYLFFKRAVWSEVPCHVFQRSWVVKVLKQSLNLDMQMLAPYFTTYATIWMNSAFIWILCASISSRNKYRIINVFKTTFQGLNTLINLKLLY